jgi:hypothetical protein
MMRLVLAAWVLALAATHAAPHAKPSHGPAAVVRAEIVSGNAQSAHGYVAPAAKLYLTEFPHMLVVRVAGPAPPKGEKRRVRFRCVTKGCVFAPIEQPEEDDRKVERVDPAAYDAAVHAKDGTAAIRVLLQANRPVGTYTVEATPVAGKGERAIPASFTLNTR